MKHRSRRSKSDSLWSIVERLQSTLEAQGLEDNVVDAAVVGRLSRLMRQRILATG